MLAAALLLGAAAPLLADEWTLTLARSRLPVGDGGVLADLLRMRAYAQAALQRPRPQLDDRWIPRLRALRLGRAIEAWRGRHSGAAATPPEHGDRPLITTAHFTGTSPAPWVGPKGWADLLTVYADDEDDDEADGDEHAAADGGTGRDEDRS